MNDYKDKLESQASMFKNRLNKRFRYLKKWASRENIGAYRLYDRDIPEIPLSVDVYTCETPSPSPTLSTYACLSLYERPYEKDEAVEAHWLETMRAQVQATLDLPKDHTILKLRKRQKGLEQYEKLNASDAVKGVVREGNLKFHVDLTSYLDTGLFLDHRPLRAYLSQHARGLRVLNLFGYTGSLSVAAAVGGASYIQTVDMSNTYLKWAQNNFSLNGLDASRFIFTRREAREFLEDESRRVRHARGYDIILLDPPTFSNSSQSERILDINREWSDLVNVCLTCLNPNGTLYFSTNSRRLSFKPESIISEVGGRKVQISDVTERSLPEDFKAHRAHRCWKFSV